MSFQSEGFHREERQDFIGKAYTKAVEILRRDEISPEGFKDLYGEANVTKDLALVASLEAKFAARMTGGERETIKLATVLEAILHEQGEQSNWFGEAATTVRTSRYDDLVNGVDGLVEFENEQASPSHVAFAVDATFTTWPEQKFARIQEEIDKGQLATIKYARVEGTGFRGELSKVPRVVVGVSAKTINELAELWLTGKKKELANHPVQFQILEELQSQCEVLSRYATFKGQADISRKYEQTREIIKSALDKKVGSLRDNGDRDDVFFGLKAALARFKVPIK